MEKYGLNNFSFSVIEECSREQLNDREIYWIKEYNSYYYDENNNGYNLTLGGNQPFNSYTEEEINTIIKLWEEGKSVGQIVKITGKSNSVILQYLKDRTSYTILEGRARGAKLSSHGEKSLNQYDLNGNFIQQFNSIRAASKAMNTDPSLIGKAANGKFKQLNGYIYIFEKDNQEEVLKRRLTDTSKNRNKKII